MSSESHTAVPEDGRTPTPGLVAGSPLPMAGSTRSEITARDLVNVVVTVPGVRGIEPGVATTLRTLDSRIRRTGTGTHHFGVHIDRDQSTATVEVGLDRSRPIRETVREIQRVTLDALGDSVPEGTLPHVRVQSVHR